MVHRVGHWVTHTCTMEGNGGVAMVMARNALGRLQNSRTFMGIIPVTRVPDTQWKSMAYKWEEYVT